MRSIFRLTLGLGMIMLMSAAASAADPAVQEALNQVGLKPQGTQRGQMDTVGIASRADQMEKVMAQATQFAAARQKMLADQGWDSSVPLAAGICPHDDYYYAGRLYTLLASRVKAKRVMLFGVFHKARIFNNQDKLVFDTFKTWHGPAGPVTVSPLREEILKKLPRADYVVNDTMQQVEHSVEAIVPFLQAYNKDVEIVSILVPFMNWQTLDRLAGDLSGVLTKIFKEKGWKLGQDVALISSADAVHYGDEGWGGSSYAPFGSDLAGYQAAVKRDQDLANSLCGSLSADNLKAFMDQCVDSANVRQYRITWCGRFSIPFGMNVAARLAKEVEGRTLQGTLLDYGTSISEASLDLEGMGGLGATAPNNLHHWVGYAAIGYR